MIKTSADVSQSQSVLTSNPAVEQERTELKQRALNALRKWVRMNPIERVFSFDLENSAKELFAFERRHQFSASRPSPSSRR